VSDGRFEGEGEFTFPDGVVYRGGFRDGQFHGSGMMLFPDGSKYEAVWEAGKEITGSYSFQDGLAYDPEEVSGTPEEASDGWNYLVPSDRRFHSERRRGKVEPAGQGWLGDGGTPEGIPEGCYDTGLGTHYDPTTETVVQTSSGKAVSRPAEKEKSWILEKCRQAVRSGVGASATMEAATAVSPRPMGEATE